MTTASDAIVARASAGMTATGPITIRKSILAGQTIGAIAVDDNGGGTNTATGDVPDSTVVTGAGLSGEALP